MDIDWDNAPEGATHYDPTDDERNMPWVKLSKKMLYCWEDSIGWLGPVGSDNYFFDCSNVDRLIPLPTKPAPCRVCHQSPCRHYNECPSGKPVPARSNEDCWPAVGCKCFFCDYSENQGKVWKRCLFLGVHDNDAVWLYLIDQNEYHTETNIDPSHFRTEVQRERDDLIELICSLDDSMPSERAYEVTEGILKAGYRKKDLE